MNRIALKLSLSAAILLAACLAPAAEPPSPATAPAGPALRVALICLAAESWAGDPNAAASAAAFGRAMKANAAALPARIGQRDVRYDVLALGPDKAGPDGYPVAVLLPEWTLMLPALDAWAKVLGDYIQRGGALVVFQPNPLTVYPPGARCPQALADRGISGEYCTPGLLPLPATFYNRYEQFEGVRNVGGDTHPITKALTDEQMPYPTDQLFCLDRRYTVLARGAASDSPSLVVGQWGRGRIVLIADNVFGTTGAKRQAPATVVARSLLWAAGEPDDAVSAAHAASPELPAVAVTTEPADEDGQGPSARNDPYCPDESGSYPIDQSRPTTTSAGGDPRAGKAQAVEPGAAAQSPPAGGVAGVLERTLASARKGEVIRLQAGLYEVGSLVIPDGVSLIGAGAANTVLKVTCPQPMGAGLELQGESVVEDMTIVSSPKRQGYMVRAAGEAARPTMRRCILLPHDNEFCAFVAWNKAAPTLKHCIVVSPVGQYGVFARDRAAPVIEYCTIVSRGFGIGMTDGSTPTIRRCIVAGQCPGVLMDAGSEPAVTDCVLWCRGGSPNYPFPITRWAMQKDPDAEKLPKTPVDPVKDITCRRDILVQDPKLRLGGGLADYLAPEANSDAAGYGAYAESLAWPRPVAGAPQIALPDLKKLVHAENVEKARE